MGVNTVVPSRFGHHGHIWGRGVDDLLPLLSVLTSASLLITKSARAESIGHPSNTCMRAKLAMIRLYWWLSLEKAQANGLSIPIGSEIFRRSDSILPSSVSTASESERSQCRDSQESISSASSW